MRPSTAQFSCDIYAFNLMNSKKAVSYKRNATDYCLFFVPFMKIPLKTETWDSVEKFFTNLSTEFVGNIALQRITGAHLSSVNSYAIQATSSNVYHDQWTFDL